MKELHDITINTPEELEEYTNETKDLCYPDSDIRITFQTNESQINDIDCMNLYLCNYTDEGTIDERFDFVGRDIHCWGELIIQDFEGRCFDGGNFRGRDYKGRNAIMWNFEGRNVYYYATFVAYEAFRCAKIEGRLENSIHKCLNEDIEYFKEDNFVYGVYSRF